ncbi:hypothetical protein ACP179_00505 (plasmid) [Xenorhabdus stockiae]|uniref:hypothetical protein n=1 Tax=Xenorhabdus stockiae TaxID=351614 RepID=UPI003CF6B48A
MLISKASQRQSSPYVAGYQDGYKGNCYRLDIGTPACCSLYYKGYAKGSCDALKRMVEPRDIHRHHDKGIVRRSWSSFWRLIKRGFAL